MKPAFPIVLIACGALGLAACAPTTEDNTRTRTGALAGAAIGGLAGATVGRPGSGSDRILRTAVGAGVGAALGGAIGARLDAQAAELRRDLGQDIDIRNTGRELIVTMPQDLLFAVDSATLRPDLQADLRTLADNLNRYRDSDIRIVGHTDNTGTAAYNQQLSERRAASVAAVLRNAGVAPGRLSTAGRGMSEPVASNATPEGRARNRRVEIFIIPHEV